MSAATKIFEPKVFQMRVLDEEHSEIGRRFGMLEEKILSRREMPAVMEASKNLVRTMMSHFFHEEQFLKAVSHSILERQLATNAKTTMQLLDIDDGLKQEEPAAVLQLLRLARNWLYWHMWTESIDFECLAPVCAKPHRILA